MTPLVSELPVVLGTGLEQSFCRGALGKAMFTVLAPQFLMFVFVRLSPQSFFSRPCPFLSVISQIQHGTNLKALIQFGEDASFLTPPLSCVQPITSFLEHGLTGMIHLMGYPAGRQWEEKRWREQEAISGRHKAVC